jgi:NADPH:quinone reductase-like Zn-dependent oxidoreductase
MEFEQQHAAIGVAANSAEPRAGTMLAIMQNTYGSADVLRLAPTAVPAMADDEVLLRVHAAGVHIGDWHVMTGSPYLMRVMGFGFRAPKARVRGTDVAGTVEAVGKDAWQFQVGDEVFGTCDGSFAEYASAREDTLAPKPIDLTFEQAAALPTSACTALQAVRGAGGVKSEQQVLIIGASGGVGMFAVQIAKSFGAEVTGVCSTPKVDLVRSIGADHVVDYTQEELTRSGQRYDLILDMGGNRSLAELRDVLMPRATLVLVGGEGGGRWIGAAIGRSMRALLLSPFVNQRFKMINAKANADDLQVIAELIEAGKIAPFIDKTYPLSQAADAIEYLHRGQARGKIIIAA